MYIFTPPDTLQDGLERKLPFYFPFLSLCATSQDDLLFSFSCLIDSASTLRRRLKLTATTTNGTLTTDTPTIKESTPNATLTRFPPLISLLPNSLALTNSATLPSPLAARTFSSLLYERSDIIMKACSITRAGRMCRCASFKGAGPRRVPKSRKNYVTKRDRTGPLAS